MKAGESISGVLQFQQGTVNTRELNLALTLHEVGKGDASASTTYVYYVR